MYSGRSSIQLDQSGAQLALQIAACIAGSLGCVVIAASPTVPGLTRLATAILAAAILVAGLKRWRTSAFRVRPRLALQLDEVSGRLHGTFGSEKQAHEVVSATLWGELCKVLLSSPTGAKTQVIVRLPADPATRAEVCAWFTWVSGMRNQGQ
jgi:hypothetical protein